MDSENIFAVLKTLLTKYEASLSVLHNKSDNYYLNTATVDKKGKPSFFGAVQIKKKYVAFHLMPIYDFPELLNDISPELKKKMQGKSCFNFKETDEKLFAELDALTRSSFEKYKAIDKV